MSLYQRRLPAADSITDIMCHRDGRAWQKAWTRPFRSYNGCSVAARLAVANPHRVQRLILAWPATNGDPDVDAATAEHLRAQGATQEIVDSLMDGETIRGVRDAQLATLNLSVLGSVPENRIHQRWTVDALVKAGAVELEGCPEPPRPEFAAYRERFIECMTAR